MATTTELTANGHGKSGKPAGQSPDGSKYAAMDWIWRLERCTAFHAALKLEIPDVLAKAEAEGKPGLSAEEIVERLPAKSNPKTVSNLTRLLRPLLIDELFVPSVVDGKKLIYSLSDVARWFLKDNKSNLLGATVYQQSAPIRNAYKQLYEIILDDTADPFTSANGITIYDYTGKDTKFGAVLSGAMTSLTNFEESTLIDALEQSDALHDVKNLVDVGGGVGTFLAEIIGRNRHIHGINFDLPYVVEVPEAVQVDGMEHRAGSFFDDSVPSGDGMILKLIMHNHGDQACISVLRNCYKALPQGGKVLIIEYVLTEANDEKSNFKGKAAVGFDIGMLCLHPDARERTLKEYDALCKAAGFSHTILTSSPDSIDIVQAFKN